MKNLSIELSQELNSTFEKIAMASASPEDFVNKAREIKTVSNELADYFQQNFGMINGRPLGIFQSGKNYLHHAMAKSPEKIQNLQAFRYYIDEVKAVHEAFTESELNRFKELKKTN